MIRVRLILQSPALEAGVRALLEADREISIAPQAPQRNDELDSKAADVQVMTSAAFARATDQRDDGRLKSAVIVLGASAQDVKRLWRAGVTWGALALDASEDELRAAVHAVAAGLVVGAGPLLSASDDSPADDSPLTEREVEVLGMLLRGLANKQIAAELALSEHTVKFHVSSIYRKLNVANRTEAVREGLRHGWITL